MNISDIAALAGVSKAAVSRYFNDGYLSEEKRAAIERAVAETGYTPNIQAQTLRTRRSGQIGVVIPRLSSESVARVTDGIAEVLSEQGYQLILATTANDPPQGGRIPRASASPPRRGRHFPRKHLHAGPRAHLAEHARAGRDRRPTVRRLLLRLPR